MAKKTKKKAAPKKAGRMGIHYVLVAVHQDCDSKPMSNKAVRRWVQNILHGTEYGECTVVDSVTLSVPAPQEN